MPKQVTILVVDDEESFRSLAREELEARGFVVKDAEGGFSALELLESDTFDLVILDIMMPDMDGMEVLRNIKAKHLAPKVVMLTGVSELKVARESLSLGADDFITKPFEFKNLLSCIDRVLKE